MIVRVAFGRLTSEEAGRTSGGYAFDAELEDLDIGDVVLAYGSEATVVGFGRGGYDGELSTIRRRAR